ncbi:MAG TPA: ADP-glyceromanno-heptose 6-epimerase [Planctomycetota bacterium]|nr:ADP-glyceromanno-heptose 6-epimerase [Planctomycetota bacterium]
MYIVTGGAGFIGSNLVRALNRRGIDDIVIVDDLEHGEKHLNLNSLAFSDIVDVRDTALFIEGIDADDVDAVLHQGACSDTTVRDGRFMMAANFEASKAWFQLAAGQCPFLYASSAAIYGDGAAGFREEAACEWPLNVYGFSKLAFDNWVRARISEVKTPVVGLRYFNVYGPQENHKGRMASVVFKLFQQASRGEDMTVFEGSKKFLRDFVYVDDVVDVNLHFLDSKNAHGIFNCGSGRAESFLELAEHTASHFDKAKIREIPFPADLGGKYQAFTRADLTGLRKAGYQREFTSLGEGVRRYVEVLKSTGGFFRGPAKTGTTK